MRLASEDDLREHGTEIRVVDGQGRALQGAVAWRFGYRIEGQTDAAGVMRVLPMPTPGLEQSLLAVHFPGKVPVFLKDTVTESDLGGKRSIEVVLRADEDVLRFKRFLDPSVVISRGIRGKSISIERDLSIVPYDVKDVMKGLEAIEWHIEFHWNFWREGAQRQLSLAIGPTAKQRPYDRWYCRMWSYDPKTTEWVVVLPFPGRFIITITRETYRVSGQDYCAIQTARPDLYVDATDPANPVHAIVAP